MKFSEPFLSTPALSQTMEFHFKKFMTTEESSHCKRFNNDNNGKLVKEAFSFSLREITMDAMGRRSARRVFVNIRAPES
jgi:hypothetical protein